MKKTFTYILILALSLFSLQSMAQESKWIADKAHTKIKFITTHMGISEVDGKFTDYNVEVLAEDDEFTDAKVEVTIEAKSIDTDNNDRDDHLRSDEFLGVSEYPEIKFTGNLKKKITEPGHMLEGELTIRDVTKEVQLDVEYKGTVEAMGATRAGFKLTGSIDRFDYNVDWNQSFTSGLVVGKEVEIECDIELNKAEE